MRRPHGTREWLGALYDRHAAGLYRYAVMILADTEGAADAVQQVFTRLADRRDRPEIEANYLRRAIRNECFSMLRDRRRKPQAADSHQILEALSACGDPDRPSPSHAKQSPCPAPPEPALQAVVVGTIG